MTPSLVKIAEGAVAAIAAEMTQNGVAPTLEGLSLACEAATLSWALTQTGGMVGKAAGLLGMPERTLRRRMRGCGVGKETFRAAARAARRERARASVREAAGDAERAVEAGDDAERLRHCLDRNNEQHAGQLGAALHECARLVAERDAARDQAAAATADAMHAERERDELREQIEGRATPPTDAEIDALEAEGGWWKVMPDDTWDDMGRDSALKFASWHREHPEVYCRWRCVEEGHCPRPWPVVTVTEVGR